MTPNRPARPAPASPMSRDPARPAARGRPPRFRRRFTSGDHETRSTMLALRDFLAQACIDPETAGTIELVLAEVCNNVTEHAYPDAVGPVDLSVLLDPGAAHCTVSDRGAALPEGTPPDKVPEPPWSLPEGGFGWYIIRSLSSRLEYRSAGGRNRLRLTIPLGRSGRA
ncbi:MAG: ATP-binding protein [Rhodobacteraceae bacterium]|nr:ATP-binding protein [Paracoccaceae bacterium]